METSNLTREQLVENIENFYYIYSIDYINCNLFSDEVLYMTYCGYYDIQIEDNKFNNESLGWFYASKSIKLKIVNDIERREKFLDIGVKLGNYCAIKIKADIFYNNANYNKAFELYTKSAEMGNYHSYCDLGDCYLFGLGVDKNKDIAFHYYLRYMKFIKDGIIIKRKHKYNRIPVIVKDELLDNFQDNYAIYKQYSNIFDMLIKLISIKELVNIILEYK